jgi:hypothetical protein
MRSSEDALRNPSQATEGWNCPLYAISLTGIDTSERRLGVESVNSLEAAERPLLSVEEPLAPNLSRMPSGATFNDFEVRLRDFHRCSASPIDVMPLQVCR